MALGVTDGDDVGEVLKQGGIAARRLVQVAEHGCLRGVERLDERDDDGRVVKVGPLERDADPLYLAVDDAGSATGDDDAFGRRYEKLALVARMHEIEREARFVVVGAVARDRREEVVGPAQIHVGVELGDSYRRAGHDGRSLICFEIRRWFGNLGNHLSRSPLAEVRPPRHGTAPCLAAVGGMWHSGCGIGCWDFSSGRPRRPLSFAGLPG